MAIRKNGNPLVFKIGTLTTMHPFAPKSDFDRLVIDPIADTVNSPEAH